MDKELLVIHDINNVKKFFNFPFENYELTLDDGLFSQYYYWPIFDAMKLKKTFFIATDLIDIGNKREQFKVRKPEYLMFSDTFECMKMYKEKGIKSNYMRIDELKYICEKIGNYIEVGGHGHKHYYISEYEGKEKKMVEDIEMMLEWFQKNLNIIPTSYSYPYYEYDEILESVLKKFGFKTIIGERKQYEDERQRLYNASDLGRYLL